jgi:zinc protease
LDPRDKAGTANLLTALMMQGTHNRTPIELEEAINELGANITLYSTDESIVISVNCLAEKFQPVLKLVEEILLEPRWDEKEFTRLKTQSIEAIQRNQANPAAIASTIFYKLIYGAGHPLASPTIGTLESVEKITIDDLKAYYQSNFSPRLAYVAAAGAISAKSFTKAIRTWETKWPAKEIAPIQIASPAAPVPNIYFVDVPNAKQSELRIGALAISARDPEFYPASVMNFKLGGGFNGIINLILREEKGYTYGARTRFEGGNWTGIFVASTSVQSSATSESVQIIKDEITRYRQGISPEDMSFTKNSLLKSNARNYETLGALMTMLNQIAMYDLPLDFIKERENFVRNLDDARLKSLAQKYLHPEQLIYVIAGDAKTQLESVKKLGLGEPVLLDKAGDPVL